MPCPAQGHRSPAALVSGSQAWCTPGNSPAPPLMAAVQPAALPRPGSRPWAACWGPLGCRGSLQRPLRSSNTHGRPPNLNTRGVLPGGPPPRVSRGEAQQRGVGWLSWCKARCPRRGELQPPDTRLGLWCLRSSC